MAPPPSNNRTLGPKESTLFKEVLNLYESRQLKKALKTADTILKKYPKHGETICMKGLILVHMGKREEGTDLVKNGMRLDLMSHIVWHVFGLIQKAEKKYDEALKSYTQALKFDKDNMNLLRDTSNLQTHLRMYDALVESRLAILRVRPNMRQHWVGLAGAYHLNGNLEEAKKTLETYETVLKEVPNYDVELSEVLLYHVRILEELGEYAPALSKLDQESKSRRIVDRTAILEQRARLTDKLDRPDDAAEAWKALIDHNSDNQLYYQGFLASRGVNISAITDKSRLEAIEALQSFVEQHPRAATPKRLLLAVTQGEQFVDLAKTYVYSGLRRGIPSLFVDLKSLYVDATKRDAIESIVEAFSDEQAKESSLSPAHGESPTTYIWSLYFLAQHHSYLHRQSKALALVTTALEHTPTLPELLMLKARILKRAGDPYGAAKNMNDARLLDGQDRFLNTKCGKYRLRAGLIDEAAEIFGMFTKKDAPSPGDDLRDMQSLLFITEEAAAYERLGKLNMALKRYAAVQRVFDIFEDDQYDFHSYSFRRFNLNVYMDMMAWEDKLRSHPAYIAAAVGACRILIRLHDDSTLAASVTADAAPDQKLSKKKAKKAAKAATEDAKKTSQSANEDKGLEPPPAKDEDPLGLELLNTSEPLQLAIRWLAPFDHLSVNDKHIWALTYDVSVRRGKYLKAAQALAQLHSTDSNSSALHVRLVHFKKTIHAMPEKPAGPTAPALDAVMAKLWPSTDLDPVTFNSQYLQRCGSSGSAVLAAAQASVSLDTPIEEVESTLFQIFGEHVKLDVETAFESYQLLQSLKSSRVDEFSKSCSQTFSLATIFSSPEEIARLRQSAVESAIENGDTETAV